MLDHSQTIRKFFDSYAGRFNDAISDRPKVESSAIRNSFADYFVGSDPNAVRGARNGLLFRLMLPFGYRRYRRLGCKEMKVTRVEVTGLDDFHAMARTHWLSIFRRKDGSIVEIEFDNIYLLKIAGEEGPKIFAWISGDERQVLEDHGIS